MAIKATRSNLRLGEHSRAMIIPAQLNVGERSTISANRLLLADVSGKISEDELLEFMEEHVEPAYWKWIEEKKNKKQLDDKQSSDTS